MNPPVETGYHVPLWSWQMLFLVFCTAGFLALYVLLFKGGRALLERYKSWLERKSGLRVVARYRYWTVEGSVSALRRLAYELGLMLAHMIAYLAPVAITGGLVMALGPGIERVLKLLEAGSLSPG